MKITYKLFALTLLVVFASCKNEKNQSQNPADENLETVTITHALGTTEVIKNPKTIVALDFASLENLDYLGVKVAGIPKSNIPSYLQKYQEDTSIVDLGTLKEINFEKLNELNPDVIFMSARLQNQYDELAKIAPTIYTEVDYKDYMNAITKNLGYFGGIFDENDKINAAIKEIEGKVDEVKQKASDLDKKALIVLHNNGRFSAYGKGSRFGVIHDVLGMKEAVQNLEVARHGQTASNEFIQEANPDYLFVIDRSAVVDKNATNKAEIENKLIQQTTAYKNGKIVYLDPEVWYLSGGGIISINKMIGAINEAL